MFGFNLFFLLLCSLILFNNAVKNYEECSNQSQDLFGAQVFLFFGQHYSHDVREQIVIYYYNSKFEPGDMIVLTKNDPDSGTIAPFYYRPKTMSGIEYTKLKPIPWPTTVNSKYQQQSYGYCGFWLRNNITSEKSCLTTHPNWMYEMKDDIGRNNLSSLIIPGTHQSGSYSKSYSSSDINRYAITQVQNIMEQLISGVRYLDLSPAYREGRYYITWKSYFLTTMDKVVNDIIAFIDNTKEIVIVSFREFGNGIRSTFDHQLFLDYLETRFNKHLLLRSSNLWNITLSEIWKTDRRVIISYHKANIYKKRNHIWPPMVHVQRNNEESFEMMAFLMLAESVPRVPLVVIAALKNADKMKKRNTHHLGFHRRSLLSMACKIGPNITQWYNELFYYSARIVLVNSIENTGIVNFAIEWNKRYSSPCFPYYIYLMGH